MKSYNDEYDKDTYEQLLDHLVDASKAVGRSLRPDQPSSSISRSNLETKSQAVISHLQRSYPSWQTCIIQTMGNNALNIIRLVVNHYSLDCWIFYIIDRTIPNQQLIEDYHEFILRRFFRSTGTTRFYDLFYEQNISVPDKIFRKGLHKFRPYCDFVHARKKIIPFDRTNSLQAFFFTAECLHIQRPMFRPIQRMLGISNSDYHVFGYICTYLFTLSAFIPSQEEFNLAKSNRLLDNAEICWEDSFKLCQECDYWISTICMMNRFTNFWNRQNGISTTIGRLF